MEFKLKERLSRLLEDGGFSGLSTEVRHNMLDIYKLLDRGDLCDPLFAIVSAEDSGDVPISIVVSSVEDAKAEIDVKLVDPKAKDPVFTVIIPSKEPSFDMEESVNQDSLLPLPSVQSKDLRGVAVSLARSRQGLNYLSWRKEMGMQKGSFSRKRYDESFALFRRENPSSVYRGGRYYMEA